MLFGLENNSQFAVLDKSFLDASSPASLQYYALVGWRFGISEVLIYELLRKEDGQRTADLRKLHRIQKNLVLLPGVGEMFRAEIRAKKPAPSSLPGHRVRLLVSTSSSGESFSLGDNERKGIKDRTSELETQLPSLIDVWRELGSITKLRDAHPNDLHAVLAELKSEVRDDRESMRQFYNNHFCKNQSHWVFPAPEQVDEQWALFD